ncbi:serine hydrolase [Leptobacterium flavescens]|uniref:Serine hydrolase n=1 Tax=Leptobacterium flavescens TaxID=472055 RepID=A0A6P0UT01_9FLAO|nr:serine hydrolase domain-containing protein [Leptobacterium flavescens]NER13506.1 serine hydrolase [Leptobacterium flavescens]
MKKPLFLVTAIIIQLGAFSLNAQQKTLYSRIDSYLTAGSENGFSGAIAVVKDGDVIINKGYGLANKDTQTLNNPNTIFDIGSNTKQFTSTAILKLEELGKLKLSDPLSKYFKDLPTDKQNITIHQLLTHTAGFPDAIGKDFDKISQEQFFKTLFAGKLLSEPGAKYSYSNTGYSVLGRIIELVSGQPYEAYVNEYLFKPAGMKQTGYLLPEWDTKQLSRSYNRGILDSESPVVRYQRDGGITWHLKANGGINSTQNDMLLWFEALKTNKILSAGSLKKLITPYTGNSRYSYAYGWTVRMLEGNIKRVSHNGSNGAYAHSLVWFPEEDVYIVYITNANSAKVEFLAYEVAKMTLDNTYVPEPIKNNVYAYAMDYIKQHPTDQSGELVRLLQENYADDLTDSGLLNTIGNLLIRFDKNLNWALELFKINVQQYPEDGNLWDSLGDGYKANNLKEEAIKSYQKAVELGYKGSQKKIAELTKE